MVKRSPRSIVNSRNPRHAAPGDVSLKSATTRVLQLINSAPRLAYKFRRDFYLTRLYLTRSHLIGAILRFPAKHSFTVSLVKRCSTSSGMSPFLISSNLKLIVPAESPDGFTVASKYP